MDVKAPFREVGTYRGAAVMCGTTHKTVRRIIEADGVPGTAARTQRARNYDAVVEVVRTRVARTSARISAKRLLPEARAAGYAGSTTSALEWLTLKRWRSWRARAPIHLGADRGVRAGALDPGDGQHTVPLRSTYSCDLVAGLRYVDRFEHRNGEWRIAKRVCVFEWRRTDPVGDGEQLRRHVHPWCSRRRRHRLARHPRHGDRWEPRGLVAWRSSLGLFIVRRRLDRSEVGLERPVHRFTVSWCKILR
jgi:hypothetical protein